MVLWWLIVWSSFMHQAVSRSIDLVKSVTSVSSVQWSQTGQQERDPPRKKKKKKNSCEKWTNSQRIMCINGDEPGIILMVGRGSYSQKTLLKITQMSGLRPSVQQRGEQCFQDQHPNQ